MDLTRHVDFHTVLKAEGVPEPEATVPDWPYDGQVRFAMMVATRRAFRIRKSEMAWPRHEPLPHDADGLITEDGMERLKKQSAARRAVHAPGDFTSRMPSR